jgi:hypothetical protein
LHGNSLLFDPHLNFNLITHSKLFKPWKGLNLAKKRVLWDMRLSLEPDDIAKDPERVIEFLGKFKEKYDQLRKDFEEIKKENEVLHARLLKLEKQLAKYLSPHIPSSKQLYPKKRSGLPISKSKQKRGGSKKGKPSPLWDREPDDIIHHNVKKCISCHKIANEDNQKIHLTKRIFELPELIRIDLQEHHIHEYECDCGKITVAGHPTIEGTSLGPNFLTFLSTTRYRTGSSFENISKLIEDNSKVNLSQTAYNRGLSEVCNTLEPIANKFATEVMNSDYFNIDETGHKLVVEGKKSQQGSKKVWVWLFATPNAAYYHVDMTRSQKALETVLKFRDPDKPPPISVSDAYPAYLNMFETKQFCWAHLLRDSKEVEDTCLVGKILHDKLVDLFQRIKAIQKKWQQKNKSASEKVYNRALKDINELAEAGSCENVRKLQNHLRKRAEYYLTCLKYPQVPMTNNHAEQLLKSVIVHRSNGKPLRSVKAMKEYGTLLTVLTTWSMRGLPVGSTLREWIGKQINQTRLLE